MVHLGDITKMSGYTIPPVDVITFGSPCQDLSIAGKRAGMAGERSGLFSEAVRIIREMRYATFGAYPKYAVWENVPGAFSSNKGEPSPCRSGTTFSVVSLIVCRIMPPLAVCLMASAVFRMCGHSYTLGAKSYAFGPRRLRSFPSQSQRNGSRR